MTKPHIHYVPLSEWPYFIGYTWSERDFWREMKRMGVPVSRYISLGANATTWHITNAPEGVSCSIICLPEPKFGDGAPLSLESYIGLVVHEVTHALQHLAADLSPNNPIGEETQAYLMQHIVQEIMGRALGSKMQRATFPASARN